MSNLKCAKILLVSFLLLAIHSVSFGLGDSGHKSGQKVTRDIMLVKQDDAAIIFELAAVDTTINQPYHLGAKKSESVLRNGAKQVAEEVKSVKTAPAESLSEEVKVEEIKPVKIAPAESLSEEVKTEEIETVEIAPAKILSEKTRSAQREPNKSLDELNTQKQIAKHVLTTKGDTLWEIAQANIINKNNINKMIMAIFINNKSAFVNNNLNLLKRNVKLKIPHESSLSTIDQRVAVGFLRDSSRASQNVNSVEQKGNPIVTNNSVIDLPTKINDEKPVSNQVGYKFTNIINRNYKLFATTGLGINYTEDHNTTYYRFLPNDVNFTGKLGGGIQTDYDSSTSIGLGARYFYNHIRGNVDPNIFDETQYTNKVHNFLLTIEGNRDLYQLSNFYGNTYKLGTRAGAGVNAYYSDLYASDVGGFGAKIDPEKKWNAALAGYFGLYAKKKFKQDELMLSLDYFYLGNQRLEKKSQSFPSNNLFSTPEYHNHNVVFSFTYFFDSVF